jgi:hypothetical protein
LSKKEFAMDAKTQAQKLKAKSPILKDVSSDVLEKRIVELEFNPNQRRDPKGSDTGGQWTDNGGNNDWQKIIDEYEKYRAENVTPLFLKMREKRLDNLPEGATTHWSYANKSVGEQIPLTDEELELIRTYHANVKISNAMYPKYKQAIETPEYKRKIFIGKIKEHGKIMNSKYPGKSPLTGKSFPAGEKIYYAKLVGISYAVPVSEIESY